MKAHNITFPRYADIQNKTRTVMHTPSSWYEVGDILIARDKASPYKEGAFLLLRITSVEVGTLSNFMKRPGEAARVGVSNEVYFASWSTVFRASSDGKAFRIQFEHIGLPVNDLEAVEALLCALPNMEAIWFQEDVEFFKTVVGPVMS